MKRRCPRRARWFLIAAFAPRWSGADLLDGEEVVECWTLTKRGAERLAREFPPPAGGIYIVRKRSEWEQEHT